MQVDDVAVIGVLTLLVTRAIKDLAALVHINIEGESTFFVGVAVAVLVFVYKELVRQGRVDQPIQNVVTAVLAYLLAAGANGVVRSVGTGRPNAEKLLPPPAA